jgi:hypothetical protein
VTIDPRIADSLHRTGIINGEQAQMLREDIERVNDPDVDTQDHLSPGDREAAEHAQRT